jgi:hypothetical protein
MHKREFPTTSYSGDCDGVTFEHVIKTVGPDPVSGEDILYQGLDELTQL